MNSALVNIKFPVYIPRLTARERELVVDCLDSTWISSKGKYISRFEKEFAEYNGVGHAAAVSNGTVALHVALEALGVGPGDEVLVPTLTYIASANAVAYTGATPIFVDSEKDYWQIDVGDAESKITDRTKAIMPVHLYGHPCDMDAVSALAKKHDLFVVEDCAEAIGSEFKGKKVGGLGHVATFSFFGNKTITTGEGGMVLTQDEALHQRIVKLKGQGLSEHLEYWHDVIGFNYRMTNICAAIGCAQMESLEEILVKKAQIAEWYEEGLAGLPVSVQKQAPWAVNTYWLTSIVTDEAEARDPLRASLRAEGVETRPVFNPLHLMPMYARDEYASDFPVAQSIADRGISLPSYPELSPENIAEICGRVSGFFQ